MRHKYTEEEKEKIAQLAYDWIREHDAWCSEKVYQSEDCTIGAVDLAADLADIKNVTERRLNCEI